MARRSGGSATADWREPASSDRSQSIGVSLQPAIPRRVAPQQSPLPLHQSPTIIAQFQSSEPIKLHCSTSLRGCRHTRAPRALANGGCHLYFAHRVTFLSCADREKYRYERQVRINENMKDREINPRPSDIKKRSFFPRRKIDAGIFELSPGKPYPPASGGTKCCSRERRFALGTNHEHSCYPCPR
jgi:hypothetical protein